MKQEWPTIRLLDENDDAKVEREEGRDRMPGAPGHKIENDDPNAAENQPEPGPETVPGTQVGVTKSHDARRA